MQPTDDYMAERTNQQILHCFTDGSCINNGSPNAIAAWACVWPHDPTYNRAEKLSSHELHTNNRAEFTGCLEALRTAARIDRSSRYRLIIYTDSQLLINSMTKWIRGWKSNGWKTKTNEPVKNVDLLKQIDAEMCARSGGVTFNYVKAHTGGKDWASTYNDQADRAAKAACTQMKITRSIQGDTTSPATQSILLSSTARMQLQQTKITAFFGPAK